MNPNIKPNVPWFLYLPVEYSGINSSTTTIIIAPAANESMNGRKFIILFDNNIPKKPPIGSRKPGIDPIKNDFKCEIFSFLSGIDKEKPSGKFCKAIDIDNVIAPPRLPFKFWKFINEKAIPIEIPSIKFLNADDKIIRYFFLRDKDIVNLFLDIIEDINLSIDFNDKVPEIKPKVIEKIFIELLFNSSVAGMSNDQIDDEIIIPDVKPKKIL